MWPDATSWGRSRVVQPRWNKRHVLVHLDGPAAQLRRREGSLTHIDEPPTTSLKRHFRYDTVNFAQGPLKLAIEFAGADHILAGSDYPHKIGSIPLMLEALNALPIAAEEKAAILGGNAKELLRI